MRSAYRAFTLWCVLAMLTCACAIAGVVKYSAPSTSAGPLRDGLLQVGTLSMSVRPQTFHVPFVSAGPIVPIVPLGPGNDYGRASSAFQVVVQFATAEAGYALDPSGVVLEVDGVEYQPTALIGPLPGNDYPREAERAIPGFDWKCRSTKDDWENWRDPVGQLPIDGRVCVVLGYDLLTPSTDQRFAIEIRGLSRGGTVLGVPRLFFSPGRAASMGFIG